MKQKKFAICYNKQISHSIEVMEKLAKILSGYGVQSFDIDELENGYDFVFVIGGDGTILKAARFYAKFKTPVFGINLGRLGLLKCGEYTALNDFVIKGCDSGRTSKFSLKINDKFVCDYLADGIIISTPTGSTAYGLSAGGPVLAPSLNAFVIVPICAHTLTARPIVVLDTEKITVCTEGKAFVSADGQESFEVDNDICIVKSEFDAKLALLNGTEFYSVLRNKLHWATPPSYISL